MKNSGCQIRKVYEISVRKNFCGLVVGQQVGDVLGKFLAAASKLSLKVLVGLQLIRMTNVSEVAALYQTLTADLYAGYGHEASFRGFYTVALLT